MNFTNFWNWWILLNFKIAHWILFLKFRTLISTKKLQPHFFTETVNSEESDSNQCYIQSQNQQQSIFPIQQLFQHSSQPECSPVLSQNISIHSTHTHPFNGPSSGNTRVSRILLKQETVSGSCISWDICKSAPHSRQITTPAPHHSVFYRPDALPAAQPTASKHWRQKRTEGKTKHINTYKTYQ